MTEPHKAILKRYDKLADALRNIMPNIQEHSGSVHATDVQKQIKGYLKSRYAPQSASESVIFRLEVLRASIKAWDGKMPFTELETILTELALSDNPELTSVLRGIYQGIQVELDGLQKEV